MDANEYEFYERIISKYWPQVIEKFSGRDVVEIADEVIEFLSTSMTEDERVEAVVRMNPLREQEKVRLVNLTKILTKREGQYFSGHYMPGMADNNYWLGVVYASYLRYSITLDEAISLLMELRGYGLDSEQFHHISQELFELRKQRQIEEE